MPISAVDQATKESNVLTLLYELIDSLLDKQEKAIREGRTSEINRMQYGFKEGKRFYKLTEARHNSEPHGSVHCFVEKDTGFVFKAAGWSQPAKGVRYDLSDPDSKARCLANCDPYGSYLYAR
jgi:hypothetical protein|tara:strand:+ start:731 stop:1099 length:369 start_codon:yes stop_codon:yes gene_type:complete